jgi:phosphoribosyl 1,2-cyclic phosphodiesterase
MSLFFASLNSGSNGNCYYVGNKREAVLVDCGISCRETEIRMNRLGLSLKKVRALFVTHEHFDHTKGIAVLSKKYQIPVYITTLTLQQARLRLKPHLISTLKPYAPVTLGDLTITAFPKQHDAVDPLSVIVANGENKVGVITDIGIACADVIKNFAQCQAAFLESNYDEHMLDTGPYPMPLKNRIRGGQGHISNREAANLFKQHKPKFMSHLILSHLSEHNNTPAIVENLFKPIAGNTQVVVATRYRETELFFTEGGEQKIVRKAINGKQAQLSLFQ